MTDQNHPEPTASDVAPVDHVYDGIQEYDNPIPGWWSWIFVATIVFTPVYIVWFHAPGMERDLIAQYDRAYAANLEQQFGELGDLTADAETILTYIDDAKWLAVGKATYQTHCVTCHGGSGEGLTGPNLTDEAYLHIETVEDIATVLQVGANNGAMPAWANRLHPNALVLTASYVASLRGTNVPGGKAPEGDSIAPWGAE